LAPKTKAAAAPAAAAAPQRVRPSPKSFVGRSPFKFGGETRGGSYIKPAPRMAADALAGKKVAVQLGMTVGELAKSMKTPSEVVAATLARLAETAMTPDSIVPLDMAQLLVLDACVAALHPSFFPTA
jgi:ABC-type amino acid transport substrate-binding protein